MLVGKEKNVICICVEWRFARKKTATATLKEFSHEKDNVLLQLNSNKPLCILPSILAHIYRNKITHPVLHFHAILPRADARKYAVSVTNVPAIIYIKIYSCFNSWLYAKFNISFHHRSQANQIVCLSWGLWVTKYCQIGHFSSDKYVHGLLIGIFFLKLLILDLFSGQEK